MKNFKTKYLTFIFFYFFISCNGIESEKSKFKSFYKKNEKTLNTIVLQVNTLQFLLKDSIEKNLNLNYIEKNKSIINDSLITKEAKFILQTCENMNIKFININENFIEFMFNEKKDAKLIYNRKGVFENVEDNCKDDYFQEPCKFLINKKWQVAILNRVHGIS